MARSALTWTLAILALLEGLSHAAISQCPRTENIYAAGENEALYTVCPGSDYTGQTVEQIRDVADVIEYVF